MKNQIVVCAIVATLLLGCRGDSERVGGEDISERRAPEVPSASAVAPAPWELPQTTEDEDEGKEVPFGGLPPTTDDKETETRVETTTVTLLKGETRGLTREDREPSEGSASPAGPVLGGAKTVLRSAGTIPPTPAVTYSFDTGTTATTAISGASQSADTNVAASTTHVCVSARDGFACYTKAGVLVGLGLDKNGTVIAAAPISASSFFQRSTSWVPDASAGSDHTKDGRIIYSQQWERFFLVYEDRSFAPNAMPPVYARLLIAVSKSNDPRDGWFAYVDTVGNATNPGQDYQYLGANSTSLLVSNYMGNGSNTFEEHWSYPIADLVNGQGTLNRGRWQNANAFGAAPCMHDTATTDAFYARRDDATHASVWVLHNGAISMKQVMIQTTVNAPGWGPQLTGTQCSVPPLDAACITYGSILLGVANAEFRDGHLTFVANAGQTWSGQTSINVAARLVQINIANYFTTGVITVEKDRTFGNSSAGDPAGLVFDYGWPGVSTNSNGDIVIGTIRSNAGIFAQQRASVWFAGQPDISSSILTQSGAGALASYHMAGSSADPSTTAVYLAQQWGTGASPSWRIRVAKMLGVLKPDIIATALTAPASIVRGATVTVQVTVMNQGDGIMPASQASLRMAPGATINSGKQALTSFSVPSLAVGQTVVLSVPVTISPTWTAGSYYIGATMDETAVIDEYDVLNNFSPFLASPYGNIAVNITN